MAIDALRERDRRTTEFFGGEGQHRLRRTQALIVGVGGLGSALAQHLALLGVTKIVLADDECLDESNRNRFIGATIDDSVGTPKVQIVARLISQIDRAISVTTLQNQLFSREVFEAVREADWVFGCFDSDGPRAVLNELAVAYDKPYIDLASDVPEHGAFGGHIISVLDGNGCLACLGVLDPDELRSFFSTDDLRAADARIYGVDPTDLDERGPSVSPMNGVVAALAASEFMLGVTGMRRPKTNIQYRGHIPSVRISSDKPQIDCPICNQRATGSVAEVERFLALDYVRERREKQTAMSCAAEVTNS